jgi:hypothetical protein
VHHRGPGVFLQGLATYGPAGNLLPGPSLPADVVRLCFNFSRDTDVACVAFLGDTCVSTAMRPYVRELNTRYYEPLAEVRMSGLRVPRVMRNAGGGGAFVAACWLGAPAANAFMHSCCFHAPMLLQRFLSDLSRVAASHCQLKSLCCRSCTWMRSWKALLFGRSSS